MAKETSKCLAIPHSTSNAGHSQAAFESRIYGLFRKNLKSRKGTHNPKVAGSNPAPAITYRYLNINLRIEVRD
jgi:hypothetical protein